MHPAVVVIVDCSGKEWIALMERRSLAERANQKIERSKLKKKTFNLINHFTSLEKIIKSAPCEPSLITDTSLGGSGVRLLWPSFAVALLSSELRKWKRELPGRRRGRSTADRSRSVSKCTTSDPLPAVHVRWWWCSEPKVLVKPFSDDSLRNIFAGHCPIRINWIGTNWTIGQSKKELHQLGVFLHRTKKSNDSVERCSSQVDQTFKA